jgi:hypothetical protein
MSVLSRCASMRSYSAAGRDWAGSFRCRPMTSAISRTGTPSSSPALSTTPTRLATNVSIARVGPGRGLGRARDDEGQVDDAVAVQAADTQHAVQVAAQHLRAQADDGPGGGVRAGLVRRPGGRH